MCNFNNLPQQTKEFLHNFMNSAARNVGGINYLLTLIEAMRLKKPHPLMQKNSQIASNNTIIKWNKVVFKDKVDLMQKLLIIHREAQEKDRNILQFSYTFQNFFVNFVCPFTKNFLELGFRKRFINPISTFFTVRTTFRFASNKP